MPSIRRYRVEVTSAAEAREVQSRWKRAALPADRLDVRRVRTDEGTDAARLRALVTRLQARRRDADEHIAELKAERDEYARLIDEAETAVIRLRRELDEAREAARRAEETARQYADDAYGKDR